MPKDNNVGLTVINRLNHGKSIISTWHSNLVYRFPLSIDKNHLITIDFYRLTTPGLRRSWWLRRQISLDYYTIPPAIQVTKSHKLGLAHTVSDIVALAFRSQIWTENVDKTMIDKVQPLTRYFGSIHTKAWMWLFSVATPPPPPKTIN